MEALLAEYQQLYEETDREWLNHPRQSTEVADLLGQNAAAFVCLGWLKKIQNGEITVSDAYRWAKRRKLSEELVSLQGKCDLIYGYAQVQVFKEFAEKLVSL